MARIWTSATLAKIGPTMSMKPLLANFFFQQEIIDWVVFASRANNGNAGCYLDKERDLRGVGREITRVQDEKMWKDEKTQENKNKNWHTMDICGHFDFGYD
jgi:hypothetical protein